MTEKRAYHSPLRQRRAAESRARIIKAAGLLFNELGYAGTTMSAIARRARVSVESVHGVGQKHELLLLAFNEAHGHDILDVSWVKELADRDDQKVAVDEWIDTHADSNRRSAGMWMAVRAAAAVEPAVNEAFASFQGARRQFYAEVLGWISRAGVMSAPPEDRMDDFAGALAVIFSAETYFQLTFDWSYSHEKYVTWLRRSLSGMDTGYREPYRG